MLLVLHAGHANVVIRRRHLLLTAEGWLYFVLALVELLSNLIPAVRGNISIFRALDVGIGEFPLSAAFSIA